MSLLSAKCVLVLRIPSANFTKDQLKYWDLPILVAKTKRKVFRVIKKH